MVTITKQPDDRKKGEHDMKILKRQDLQSLRDNAPKGTKVLRLWDHASIDYQFWLTHNLMLLLENDLKMQEGMNDTVEPKKKKTRAKRTLKGWRKKLVPSFINSFFKRATQRTCRFIRWLRASLFKRLAYKHSLDELADVWQCKIT